MTHLTPDEFVDAADGTLETGRLRHVEQCERCRQRLETLVEALQMGAAGPVPEPSPLFWEHFSARVRNAIAAEPAPPQTWWPGWLRWSVLAAPTPVTTRT